ALQDRSAEAYFAQVVLHRLLGRSSALLSAVTGLIGDRLRDDDGADTLNYAFVPPDPASLSAKLAYVFSSRQFERIVVPTDPRDSAKQVVTQCLRDARKGGRGRHRQSAEVLRSDDLATVADCVQTRGWRQLQYIRCPEIEWALRGPTVRHAQIASP